MNPEKEIIVQNLFKELHEKPAGLDEKIMEKILAAQPESVIQENSFLSKYWVYCLVGIISIAGLGYAIQYINFSSESFIWIVMLSALIPLLIDRLITARKIFYSGTGKETMHAGF